MLVYIQGSAFGSNFYSTVFDKTRHYTPNIYYRDNGFTSIHKDSAVRSGTQLVRDLDRILGFAADYYAHFGKLKGAAQDLIAADSRSVFQKRAVEVDDPEVFSARAQHGALVDIYDVSVEKLAVAREEVSGFFERDVLVTDKFDDMEEEKYQFRIIQNGREETFSVAVKEKTDAGVFEDKTFYEVIKQIADKINESSLDIIARYGRERGLSSEMRLVLTADEPGTASSFTISDIPGDDNIGIMEKLGMEKVREAEDVRLDIAGVGKHSYFSRGDRVFLISDYGVELDLNKTGQTYFAVTRDVKGIRQSLEQFAGTFGKVLSFMKQTGTNGELEQLAGRLADIVRSERENLKSVGINVDDEGRMRIDKNVFDGLLEKKLEEDFEIVEEMLGGVQGIAARVETFSDEALRMTPLRFMHEPREVDLSDFLKDGYDISGRTMLQFYGHLGLVLDMML